MRRICILVNPSKTGFTIKNKDNFELLYEGNSKKATVATMTYEQFRRNVRKAYDGIEISFSSNGAQHTAEIDDCLILYKSAESKSVYGKMNGVYIGRCMDIRDRFPRYVREGQQIEEVTKRCIEDFPDPTMMSLSYWLLPLCRWNETDCSRRSNGARWP